MTTEAHDPYECSDLACAECWEFHLQQGVLSDLSPDEQRTAQTLADEGVEP